MGQTTRSLGLIASSVMLLGAFVPDAFSQVYNLANGNSTLSINASSPAGLFNYSVDSINQATDQWFWYRAGTMTSEASIDTIGTLTGTQADAADLSLLYTGTQYTAKVTYKLTGAGADTGHSGITESIVFKNISASTLSLSFFDYNNFTLGGMTGGQTLQFTKPNPPFPQYYNGFSQTGLLSLSTSLSSAANVSHVEAANYDQTLTKLNDNSATTLNDNAGPVSGDVTGTFEWDLNLAPNASLTISELVNVVPEPSSTVLLTLGLVAGAALYRRRRGTRSA